MRSLLLLALLALAPPSASAVTLDEVLALSQAGVSDVVVLALIDRDKSVFAIEPEQLIALKQAGVSEAVVVAMLKSGREAPAEAPDAFPLVGPETTVIGHGPDVPNANARPAVTVLPVPVQYVVIGVAPAARCAASLDSPRPFDSARDRAAPFKPTFGRFMNDPTARFMNNGFLPPESFAGSALVDCAQSAPRRHAPPRR